MQVPIVNKLELQVADIEEDDFVSFILETGELKTDLKMPVEDEEIYPGLKKLWDENNEKGDIFFTIISACKQEKIISGRLR
jgi:hypothetical protein